VQRETQQKFVQENAWNPDRWYPITQSSAKCSRRTVILGDLSALESTRNFFSGIGPGEYVRVLVKRKWTVLACLIIIFSLVAIASLKMTPVYEASGSIAINKPDSGLVNFSNSPTFSVDYYDPTEMETEVKILQSDLLALQVIKELGLDRRPEFGGRTAPLTSSLDLAPILFRPMPDAQLPCSRPFAAI